MFRKNDLIRISDNCWELSPASMKGMRVPARVYANETLIGHIVSDDSLQQVANVATLPGIQKYSLAMPDIHSGYGFPIGGVAATDIDEGGVISPGGIGYDINCGVRLMRTNLCAKDVSPVIDKLVTGIYNAVPVGVGGEGDIRLTEKTMKKLLEKGARWTVEQGFGTQNDLDNTESNGCLTDARAECVSNRAVKRGLNQAGTLGSGNHFIEIQQVEQIYDEQTAYNYGLEKEQIVVMIHTGSRGLGYQVCTDAVEQMRPAPRKYGYELPDKQLVCAPFRSPEGQDYFGAVCAAANFAWGNRQYIMELVRRVFERVYTASAQSLGMSLLYDVAHNIAKIETYSIDGKKKRLCVHRKGATRAFPAGHPDVPSQYRSHGQPVLVPGDMGTQSFVLTGLDAAMQETFGSMCHGAGRMLSRTAAKKKYSPEQVIKELNQKGITIMAKGRGTIVEEASGAYKDVGAVVQSVVDAGLAKRVARLCPIGVVKG